MRGRKPNDDWLADVVEDYPGVEDAGSGSNHLGDGEYVTWSQIRIPVDLSWEVRGEAIRRTYRVTTITDLTDGTSIVSTYLVPGLYLPMWLGKLQEPSEEPEIVLSVEVAARGR